MIPKLYNEKIKDRKLIRRFYADTPLTNYYGISIYKIEKWR